MARELGTTVYQYEAMLKVMLEELNDIKSTMHETSCSAEGINDYILRSVNLPPKRLKRGMVFSFIVPESNTGKCTIKIDNVEMNRLPLLTAENKEIESYTLFKGNLVFIVFDGYKFVLADIMAKHNYLFLNNTRHEIIREDNTFNLDFVCKTETGWVKTDPRYNLTADGLAISIDEHSFILVKDGIFDLPEAIIDDMGNPLSEGHIYFISQTLEGTVHKERYVEGIEQPAFKVINASKNTIELLIQSAPVFKYGYPVQTMTIEESELEVLRAEVRRLNNKVMKLESDIGVLQGSINVKDNVLSIYKVGHGFNFTPVAYDTTLGWVQSNLADFKIADGIAIKINNDNFEVVTSGIVDVPDNKLDDEGNLLESGGFYYVSQKSRGMFHREGYEEGLEQTGVKLFSHNGKLKAIVVIGDEINFKNIIK